MEKSHEACRGRIESFLLSESDPSTLTFCTCLVSFLYLKLLSTNATLVACPESSSTITGSLIWYFAAIISLVSSRHQDLPVRSLWFFDALDLPLLAIFSTILRATLFCFVFFILFCFI
jgi:hypothetical protein